MTDVHIDVNPLTPGSRTSGFLLQEVRQSWLSTGMNKEGGGESFGVPCGCGPAPLGSGSDHTADRGDEITASHCSCRGSVPDLIAHHKTIDFNGELRGESKILTSVYTLRKRTTQSNKKKINILLYEHVNILISLNKKGLLCLFRG